MVLHFLCFYGHPTLSIWFTSEYKKSGKKRYGWSTGLFENFMRVCAEQLA
jgi:hypothetical protein